MFTNKVGNINVVEFEWAVNSFYSLRILATSGAGFCCHVNGKVHLNYLLVEVHTTTIKSSQFLMNNHFLLRALANAFQCYVGPSMRNGVNVALR